jgi:hypothetical protein
MKNRFIVIALLLTFLMTSNIQAQTCAQFLKAQVIGWGIGSAIFPPLWPTAIMLVFWAKDAKRLKSASIIANGLYPAKTLAQAHKVIDRYYGSLTRDFPDLMLGKDEVIKVLHRFNMNSVSNRQCQKAWDFMSVASVLFPDDNTAHYLAIEKKQKARANKADNAQKIRNQKNNAGIEEVFEYDL